MTEIPVHKDYFSNAERCKGNTYPCVVCGRPAPNPKYMVRVIYGTHVGTQQEAESTHIFSEDGKELDGGDLGLYPIGSDCLKKHPELKEYAIKTA